MNKLNIKQCQTRAEFESVFPVIRELRPHLTIEDFTAITLEASKRDDYEIVGIFEDEKCIAAMGFRTLYDFVHGKHLYIDDLVVTEGRRSNGLGAKLLQYAEAKAAERKCYGLRLCTGIDRKDSQRFYEKNNWNARAIAYKKIIPS